MCVCTAGYYEGDMLILTCKRQEDPIPDVDFTSKDESLSAYYARRAVSSKRLNVRIKKYMERAAHYARQHCACLFLVDGNMIAFHKDNWLVFEGSGWVSTWYSPKDSVTLIIRRGRWFDRLSMTKYRGFNDDTRLHLLWMDAALQPIFPSQHWWKKRVFEECKRFPSDILHNILSRLEDCPMEKHEFMLSADQFSKQFSTTHKRATLAEYNDIFCHSMGLGLSFAAHAVCQLAWEVRYMLV
jgi:hypothetical protein